MAKDDTERADSEDQSQAATIVDGAYDGADGKYEQGLNGTNPGDVGGGLGK